MNSIVASSLLQLVYRNSLRTSLPACIAIAFIAYNLQQHTTGNLWVWWAAFAAFLYIFRPLAIHWISTHSTLNMRSQLLSTGIYTALSGCAMGMCVLFFPQLPVSVHLIISLILAGFGAGSNATNAGYPPLFMSFIVPLLLPLGLLWIMNPDNSLGYQISISIGALIVMMIVLLSVLGRDTFRTFAAYAEMSEKQSAMSDQLAQALKNAETERERAQASSLAKTRFIAAASHDLRQPVHVISLYSSALQTIVKSSRAKDVVKDMNTAVDSLSSQLNALLDVSRLDAGGVQPEFSVVDIKACVDLVVTEFETEAKAKEIELLNRMQEPLFALTDTNLLMQILRNLLGNAIKYTHKGYVCVDSVTKPESITLRCTDTGVGMNESELNHILEEFYQVDEHNRDKRKGLGLGLSIVERLVKCLAHEMSIESEPGKGTTVSLLLKRESQVSDSKTSKPRMDYPVDSDESFDLWVHIVDDEAMVRRSMSMLLEELGCKVTSTSSTLSTIAFLKENQPDVVIADLILGSGDSGVDTLNEARKLYPEINRVMITGEVLIKLDQAGLSKDVSLLHKPVGKNALSTLLQRVEAHPVTSP